MAALAPTIFSGYGNQTEMGGRFGPAGRKARTAALISMRKRMRSDGDGAAGQPETA